VHLPLQHVNVGHARLQDVQLSLQIVQLDFKDPDFVQAVTVLRLTLGQRGVLDLDLFVQQCKLVVTADEL
jgi:hypothetical protein